MNVTHLECANCQKIHQANVLQNLCVECGKPLLVIYDLDKRIQVPGYQYVHSGRTYERQDGKEAHWRGIYDDKGRVQVAICHNVDLGDAWEWSDDPSYPEPFAGMAYRIGLNYITYAMTH